MLLSERRALAVVVLGFYTFCYLMLALVTGDAARLFFVSLTALYGVGAFSLVAGYFWARWFTRGVGFWGAFAGGFLLLQAGLHPVLIFFCVSHVVLLILVAGPAMVGLFEGQHAWRQRFQVTDDAADKIGTSVTNVVSMLPYLVLYVVRPRYEGVAEVLAPLALVLAVAGVWGLIRLRTWGLLATGAAAFMFLLAIPSMEAVAGVPPLSGGCLFHETWSPLAPLSLPVEGALIVGGLLAVPFLRFLPAMARFLSRPDA